MNCSFFSGVSVLDVIVGIIVWYLIGVVLRGVLIIAYILKYKPFQNNQHISVEVSQQEVNEVLQ